MKVARIHQHGGTEVLVYEEAAEPKIKANQVLVELLATIAQKKKATQAQIALAWLLAQKPWIVPIPGTTKLPRLEENLGAAAIDLSDADLRDIDNAASQITVHGARYSEGAQRLINR